MFLVCVFGAPTTKSESPLLKLMSHWFVRTATHLKDQVSHYDSIQMSLKDSLEVSLR